MLLDSTGSERPGRVFGHLFDSFQGFSGRTLSKVLRLDSFATATFDLGDFGFSATAKNRRVGDGSEFQSGLDSRSFRP